MSRFRLALSVCALSLSLTASPALADPGSEAYRMGNYGTAIQAWRSVAYEDPYAAFNLGLMYETGRGTAEDFREALKWYKKAGENGRGAKYKKLRREAAHALVRVTLLNEYALGTTMAYGPIRELAIKTGDPHSLRMLGLLKEFQAKNQIANRVQNSHIPMQKAYGYLKVAADRGAPLAEAEAKRVLDTVKDKGNARREATRIKQQLKDLGIN